MPMQAWRIVLVANGLKTGYLRTLGSHRFSY